MYECASHRFGHKPPNWILIINATFNFTLAPKRWLVCTTFSVTILLHLRIHSYRNYSPVFLHVFILISSITLLTNTPWMMNQPIQSTLQFLPFILTIQPPFLKPFYTLLVFYATPRFLPPSPGTKHKKGRRPRTTDDPEEGPKAYSTSMKPPDSANLFS